MVVTRHVKAEEAAPAQAASTALESKEGGAVPEGKMKNNKKKKNDRSKTTAAASKMTVSVW